MSKIKIYDADAYIRDSVAMTCHSFGQVAIFEGPRGVVVAERDAVLDRFQSVEDPFSFMLTKIPEPGKMYIMPTHRADIPVKDIMDKAPSQEMEFYDFFSRRNYNLRCENNFRFLCDNLRDIGIEIPKEPLSMKVQQAAGRVMNAHPDQSKGISISEQGRG